MYLKTYSPYLDSPFIFYNKSQNIIGVNLLGTLLYSSVVLIMLCFTYIPSPLADLTMFTAQGFVTYSLLRSQYNINDVIPLKVLIASTLKAATLRDENTSIVEDKSIEDL